MAKKITIKKPSKSSNGLAPAVITDFFEVKLVRLLSCSSELTVSGPVKPPFEVELTFSVHLNEGVKSKVVLVNVGVDVYLKQNAEAPHATCPKVAVVFQVVFQAKGDFPVIDDDDRKTMVMSGSVVAWPYLRGHVQSTISAMGLPPVVLPLFHPAQLGCAIGRIGDTDVAPASEQRAAKRKPKPKMK